MCVVEKCEETGLTPRSSGVCYLHCNGDDACSISYESQRASSMAHQAVAVALASFKKLCSAASLVSMSAISADASPCFAIGGLTSAFAGLASAFSLPAMSASLFLTSRRILPGDDATALVLSAFFLAR